MKAIIIGAGLGGLALAVRLQSRGVETTIVEGREKPGGCAVGYEMGGYTFDGGPSVLLAPQLLEEIFSTAGEKLSEHISLLSIEPQYRFFFNDGRIFDRSFDADKATESIKEVWERDLVGYQEFLTDTEKIFETVFEEHGRRFHGSLWGSVLDFAKLLPQIGTGSLYDYLSKYFESEMLRRVFCHHPLLFGVHPKHTPALFSILPYMESRFGARYPRGGFGALIDALVKVFINKGGELQCGKEVAKIEILNRHGRKVHLANGEVLEADLVVSNADVLRTYGSFIDSLNRPFNSDEKLSQYAYSPSAVVIYFGVKRKYPELLHHNFIYPDSYDGIQLQFRKEGGSDIENFYFHLNIPSRTDESLAPEGHEACSVVIPVSENALDWEQDGAEFENRVLKFIDRNYMPGLLENMTVRFSVNPKYYGDVLGANHGAAYGLLPQLGQLGYFRPHNKSQDVENLYLVGAGTQPGLGLPGVLLSAEITDKLIAQDFGL